MGRRCSGRNSSFFADLDGFKGVNNTHGHHVGDRVLAGVGSRIAAVVRAEDLVARCNGDNFSSSCPTPRRPGRNWPGGCAGD